MTEMFVLGLVVGVFITWQFACNLILYDELKKNNESFEDYIVGGKIYCLIAATYYWLALIMLKRYQKQEEKCNQ